MPIEILVTGQAGVEELCMLRPQDQLVALDDDKETVRTNDLFDRSLSII